MHPEDQVLSRAVGPARYSQVARKQVAGPGRDDTEGDARSDQRAGDPVDGTVAANNDDDITAVFDRPARDVAQLGLPIDDVAVDYPARPLERGANLSHRAVDVTPLASPADDERGRHGPGGSARRLLSHSPGSNAANTMSSQAAPARSPPTTSVK